MKRSAVLGIALLGALCVSPATAQQVGKTYRVGIFTSGTVAKDRPYLVAFRRALSGLGYVEGKNLEIAYRNTGGDLRQLPALATDVVQAKPDVIVVSGNPTIAAAQHATTSVPIVMVSNADPVGSGFITSLARPGGNITGLTNMVVELAGKRLQLLEELVPRLRRVAVTYNPSNIGNVLQLREAEKVAAAIGIVASAIAIRSADEIDAAFKTIPRLHADAILVLADGVTDNNALRVVRLVAAQRLPAVYPFSEFTAAAGLMYYGRSTIADWSQAANYVDRILKGANPADLPVERPTTFELVVNPKAARDIGITIPQSILLRADQVIR